ncbi:MAG TPA: cation transporter [Candidatus Kapabacteria bacterium]|jgi:divalent metal cation (Fe/Co/Zn/Cd) transporter|nr:cation transporter [Candidatus Kapabacteria bacterium]
MNAIAHTTDHLLLKSAIRVEILTLVWMTIEASLSVGAGIQAGSASLIAFGVDSVIELVAAGVLLWQLRVQRAQKSPDDIKRAERIAGWTTSYALLSLCMYIVAVSAFGLLTHTAAESSAIGIAVTAVAAVGMPFLGRRKRTLAGGLRNTALRAEAACSITCGYMAATVLLGLVVNAATGWWWTDSVAALILLYWLIPETKEAFESAREGKAGCECGE